MKFGLDHIYIEDACRDSALAQRFPGDPTENDACIRNLAVANVEPQRQRRHREVPHTARPEFLERRTQTWRGRRQDDFGKNLVEANHVGLNAPVH